MIAWGDHDVGSLVLDQDLRNVVKIQSNPWAFAAILHDGSVMAWGDLDKGGAIGYRLMGVRDVQASARAFAAIRNDGSVEAWGDEDGGGFLPDDIVDCKEIAAYLLSSSRNRSLHDEEPLHTDCLYRAG